MLKKTIVFLMLFNIANVACKAKEKPEADEVSKTKKTIEYWEMEEDPEMIVFLAIKPKKDILKKIFKCLVIYKPEEKKGYVYVPFDKNIYEINIEEKDKNDYFLSNPKNGKKRRIYKTLRRHNRNKVYWLLDIKKDEDKIPEIIQKRTELGGGINGYYEEEKNEDLVSPEEYMKELEKRIKYNEEEPGLSAIPSEEEMKKQEAAKQKFLKEMEEKDK